MPQSVTHFLIAAIVVNLIRDYLVKDKRSFPLHLVLIGGIAGLLPDFDVGFYYIFHDLLGLTISEAHRTITHTLWVSLFFFVMAFVFWNHHNRTLNKRHLTISNILWVLGIGTFIHIILDSVVEGQTTPFFPVLGLKVGLNIVGNLPSHIHESFSASLDAILLMFWMVYIELKHKISNFI